MNNFFKTASEIKAWLDDMAVTGYTLHPHPQHGFVVDVDADVHLFDKKINALPVHFNHVSGDFNCSNNHLTSLLGCPNRVGKNFNCMSNQLTSLEYGPQHVGGDFQCQYNHLTTLKGSPLHIKGHFVCFANQLTNLLHGPHEVDGRFFASNNHLTSLLGCPEKIGSIFSCINNQIKNLEFCPKIIKSNLFCCDKNPLLGHTQNIRSFKEIYQIHLGTLIELEKENLLKNTAFKTSTGTTYKI